MNQTVGIYLALVVFFCSPTRGANVSINAAGAKGNHLVIPIPEDPSITKTRQKCVLTLYTKDDFNGRLNVKATASGSSTIQIKFWEAPTGGAVYGDGTEFNLAVTNGKFDNNQKTKEIYVEGVNEADNKIALELFKGPSGNEVSVFNPPDNKDFPVAVVAVGIREVRFAGASGSYIPLTADDGTFFPPSGDSSMGPPPPGPHWKDDGDGAPESNYSVAYVKSSSPEIGAKVKIKDAASYVIKLKATGFVGGTEQNVKFDETGMSNDSADVAKLDPVAAGSWPGTIKFYGKSSPAGSPAFELKWEISIDDGNKVEFATTKHQVYVTLTEPNSKVTVNQESLFYYACHYPDGTAGTTANYQSIVDNVWKEFSDFRGGVFPSMMKVDPTTGNPTVTPVLRFDPALGPDPLKNGGSQCAGWALFFQRVLGVHSIQVNVCELKTLSFPRSGYDTSKMIDRRWFVKEQVLNTDKTWYIQTLATNKGQGHGHPKVDWEAHTISEFGGNYYDPSYGVKGTSKGNYEDNAISGYGFTYVSSWRKDVAFDRTPATGVMLEYTNKVPY